MEGGLRARGITKFTHEDLPLVSIITVVYNRVKYLEQAILSVLNQTYSNLEYIVIDGGSTDGTIEIIKKYDDRLDFWISEPDSGMYFALNKGIQYSQGEFIGLCHSDDYYYNNSVIEDFISIHTNTSADIYHGDILILNANKVFSDRITSNSDLLTKTNNSINHPTTFISKSVFQNLGFYNTNFKSSADYELMLRFKVNKCQFLNLGIIISVMRVGHEGRISNNCFSILENYQIHRIYKTGQQNKYLLMYVYCNINQLAKILKIPDNHFVRRLKSVLRKLLVRQ
jgi:glycosyltransferase involved in cell wall biosynthesis